MGALAKEMTLALKEYRNCKNPEAWNGFRAHPKQWQAFCVFLMQQTDWEDLKASFESWNARTLPIPPALDITGPTARRLTLI